MNMVIRSTSEKDWEALKTIRLAALLDTPTAFGISHASAAAESEDAWRERAAGRGRARFILAFDAARAVGIIAYIPAPAPTLTVEAVRECGLIAMWVAPALRGSGMAAKLVAAVKARALAEGQTRVVLDVAPENARAAAFYRKQGFVFLPEWEALASHPHIQVQKMAWAVAAA